MTSLFSTARCSSSRNSVRGIHSITHHPVHILVAVLPPALMVFLKENLDVVKKFYQIDIFFKNVSEIEVQDLQQILFQSRMMEDGYRISLFDPL